MNSRTFAYVFFTLGIVFALLSIYLSLKPVSMKEMYRIYIPFGIITTGFISGVCFFVSGYLVKKNVD